MTLYFTYESRDTLPLFLSVKTITKLNLGHSDQVEIKVLKYKSWGFTFSRKQNLVFSCCCFAEDDKEMY